MTIKRRFFLCLHSPHLKLIRNSHQKTISAEWVPQVPKVDETISLKFLNLPAKTKVRLDTTLTTPGEKLRFLSSCIFPVDSNGTLDLSETPRNRTSIEVAQALADMLKDEPVITWKEKIAGNISQICLPAVSSPRQTWTPRTT